jgi:prephenate dehydrogenase
MKEAQSLTEEGLSTTSYRELLKQVEVFSSSPKVWKMIYNHNHNHNQHTIPCNQYRGYFKHININRKELANALLPFTL